MPVYNHAQFLPESLDSIMRQQFRDWELIIVDDASTDATPDICRRYLSDPRVRYVRRDVNGHGAGVALNTGFPLCTGELETWWASDNTLYSNAWKLMVKFLDEHPDVDYVYANGELAVMDETGLVEIKRKNLWEEVDQNWVPGKILRTGYFLGLMWIWRRPLRIAVGEFQPEPCEDADFVLRAEEAGFKFAYLSENLGWQRRHNLSLTAMFARPQRWDRFTFNKARRRRGLPCAS
jgi:glycosyltransferase involved in cell wall biosynthesis